MMPGTSILGRMEEISMLEFIEHWIKHVIFFISEAIGTTIMINK